jgi:hypothetical protein
MPVEDAFGSARRDLGVTGFKGKSGPDEGFSERYDIDRTHCQLEHVTISAWEREITRVFPSVVVNL